MSWIHRICNSRKDPGADWGESRIAVSFPVFIRAENTVQEKPLTTTPAKGIMRLPDRMQRFGGALSAAGESARMPSCSLLPIIDCWDCALQLLQEICLQMISIRF